MSRLFQILLKKEGDCSALIYCLPAVGRKAIKDPVGSTYLPVGRNADATFIICIFHNPNILEIAS